MNRHIDCHRILNSVAYLVLSDPRSIIEFWVENFEQVTDKELVATRVDKLLAGVNTTGYLPDEMVDMFLLPVLNGEIPILKDGKPIHTLRIRVDRKRRERSKK